jgi:hypothetical protein
MAKRIQAKQLDKNIAGWVGVSGLTVSSATITASTIAFVDSNPDTITDSGSGFGSFTAGDRIVVSGSGSNDGTYTIATAAAGTLTLIAGDALVAESAGASVTISVVGQVVTSELTTAAATAGNNGTAVTDQNSTGFDVEGWITASGANYVYIADNTTKQAVDAGDGTDVYARLSTDGTDFYLTYYYLSAGTETEYAFGSADTIVFTPSYNYELDDYPYDSNSKIPNVRLLEDPASADVGTFAEAEQVVVTADDTLEALDNTPKAGAKVSLAVNSSWYHEGVHFTRVGTAITWTFTKGTPNFGFTLKTTDDVYAYYRY